MRRDDHFRFHRLIFEELNLFSSRNFCVFPPKCSYFHNFDFGELSEAVSHFFRGNAVSIEAIYGYSWTHNAENNRRKPMPCFSFIWLQNQALWCFFSRQITPMAFSCNFHFSICFIQSVWIGVFAWFFDTSEWQGLISVYFSAIWYDFSLDCQNHFSCTFFRLLLSLY